MSKTKRRQAQAQRRDAERREAERQRRELAEKAQRRKVVWTVATTFVVPLVVAVLGLALYDLFSGRSTSEATIYCVVTAAIVVAVAADAYVLRKRSAYLTALVLAIVVPCAAFGIYHLQDTRRLVAGYVEDTCSDPMWRNYPACFRGSGRYVVDHFSAFDPHGWHGWDENPDAQTYPISMLPQVAVSLDGVPIRSVGRVRITQSRGGDYVVQLKQITEEQVELVDSSPLLDGLFPDYRRAALSEGSVAEGVDSPVLVYCNFTPRPFFEPQQGELLAFTGVPIAFGGMRVVREGFEEGVSAQVVYVLCSSVERITE